MNSDLYGSDDIHVWELNLNVSPAELEACSRFLSASENERANRFFFEADRSRFIASHGMLRKILGRYVSARPDTLLFEQGKYGKPYLANPGAEWLKFNLSHSHERGLLAVSHRKEVGVDIESTQRLKGVAELAGSIFSNEDLLQFTGLPLEQHDSALFSSWVRKEAYLKMLGTGLSRDPRGISVPFSASIESVRIHDSLSPHDRKESEIHPLVAPQGYLAALAIEPSSGSAPPRIVASVWPPVGGIPAP